MAKLFWLVGEKRRNKKGMIADAIKGYLMWIIILIIAGAAVYFAIKKLGLFG